MTRFDIRLYNARTGQQIVARDVMAATSSEAVQMVREQNSAFEVDGWKILSVQRW